MGQDTYTQLNPGCNGNVMDETLIIYPTNPTKRHRPRVQIAGCGISEIAEVRCADPDSADCGLVVRNIPSGVQEVEISVAGDPVTQFGNVTSVSDNTETTVSSFIVPVGKTFTAVGFVASGTVNARFNFYIDTTLYMVSRSTVAQQTVDHSFQLVGPSGAAGLAITVKVIHERSNINADFEATILGRIV